MRENDLTNIDCRKSNLNKMTQHVPEPLRAMVFRMFDGYDVVDRIDQLTDHIWAVEYHDAVLKEHKTITVSVNESDYWDRLSHVEVGQVLVPIQPK